MSRINSLTYGVGFLLVVAFGCQPGEAPAPEYTYIYSEAPRPPSSANDLSLAGSPSMGAEDALITVIESSDFECPFCSRVVPTMKQLLEKNPDVRVVFKHNPLSFHKRALPAAIASMAAHEQGKFWEYHDLLFAGKRFSDNDLKGYAQQLGLDMPRFEADLQDPRLREKVLHDQKTMVSGGLAGRLLFLSTVSFFLEPSRFELFRRRSMLLVSRPKNLHPPGQQGMHWSRQFSPQM